jgi:hypothetical protein
MAAKDTVVKEEVQEVKTALKKRSGGGRDGRAEETILKCNYCGGKHARKKEKCPAYGKVCNTCEIKNHFATCCRKKVGHRKVRQFEEDYTESESEDEILHIDDQKSDSNRERSIKAKMTINKHPVRFLLDSGATTNVLPETVYREVTGDRENRRLQKSKKKLVMFNGTEMTPAGEIILRVRNPKNGKKYKVNFVIVEKDCKPVLGLKAVQYMQLMTINVENMIAAVTTEQKPSSKTEVMAQYNDVFEGEGKLEGQLHLETDPNVSPVKMPCRKWPIAIQEKVKQELKRLEKLDVVAKVNTPTDWISSVVINTKPNGKVRLCIDPKPLNKALKRNDYPIPTIDDVLPQLQGAQYFIQLQLLHYCYYC